MGSRQSIFNRKKNGEQLQEIKVKNKEMLRVGGEKED